MRIQGCDIGHSTFGRCHRRLFRHRGGQGGAFLGLNGFGIVARRGQWRCLVSIGYDNGGVNGNGAGLAVEQQGQSNHRTQDQNHRTHQAVTGALANHFHAFSRRVGQRICASVGRLTARKTKLEKSHAVESQLRRCLACSLGMPCCKTPPTV